MSAVLRTVLSLSAVSAVSRVTGYVRTMAQAAFLGTGLVANAYAVSSILPNLIYGLFLGGIIYSIFIPILVERITSHGEEDARRLVSALATVIVPLMAVVIILAVVFAAPLVNLLTSWQNSKELTPEEARRTAFLTVLLFRVFILQIFFWSIGSLATGILNAHRRFFLPLFTPIVFNLFVIASLVGYFVLYEKYPLLSVYLLAGVPTLGVALVTLALLPSVWRLGYKPRILLGHPALVPALRLAGPMVIFVVSSVLLQVISTHFASLYNGNAILGYAFVVFTLPYGIFVISLETVLMPELSEKHARGDLEGYRESLSFGLRTMAFLIVPSTVALIVLARPIVSLLYERGKFGEQAVQSVSALLVAYSVGLLGYSAYFLLVRAFYSRQNSKVPALLNVGLLVLYAVLAYGLSEVMDLRVVGLALALSVANVVFAVLCLAATRREIKRIQGRRLLRSLAKIFVAGAVMYAAAWAGTTFLGDGSGLLDRILILAAVGGGSLAVYVGAAFLLGIEEMKSAAALLLRRRNAAPEG